MDRHDNGTIQNYMPCLIDRPKSDPRLPVADSPVDYLMSFRQTDSLYLIGFPKEILSSFTFGNPIKYWTWASIGVAPQSQSGYTYTWNVPFTGTDAVASEYVIQGQGYAPLRDVFMGTLRQYGAI